MVPYTQTFPVVPDQWPEPSPGTIGLGTIQGEVGEVKTKSKRDSPQEALVTIQTAVPDPSYDILEAVPTDLDDDYYNEPILPSRRRHIRRSP